MSDNLRAIFHVESAAGLGHHAGISKVVTSLTENYGFEVTVVSGTFVDPHTFYPTASVYELPSFYIKRDSEYYYWNKDDERTPYQNFNIDFWHAQRAQALGDIYYRIKPHAFITECWVLLRKECDHELSAVHAISKNQGIPTVFADSMRDIYRDVMPKDERENVECPPRITNCANMLDALLVHSDPNFITFDSTFPHVDIFGRSKIHHTGYIAEHAALRRNIPSQKRHVIVSIGSGDSGDTLLRLALEAWHQSSECFKSLTWHFVTGPRYGRDKFKEFLTDLQRKSALIHCPEQGLYCDNPHFILSQYRTDFLDLLADCAISISLGGYNTTMEVLRSGVPAVILPKFWLSGNEVTKHDSEQRSRSELLQSRGVTSTLSLASLTQPLQLVGAMHRAVEFAHNRQGFKLDFSGADRSASIIRQLVELKVRQYTRTPEIA